MRDEHCFLGSLYQRRQSVPSTFFLQGKGADLNLGHWVNAAEEVSWKIAVAQPGAFKARARYAATGGGNRFRIEVRDAAGDVVSATEAERKSSGGWDKFREWDLGELKVPTAGTWEIRLGSADGKAPMLNFCRLNLQPN